MTVKPQLDFDVKLGQQVEIKKAKDTTWRIGTISNLSPVQVVFRGMTGHLQVASADSMEVRALDDNAQAPPSRFTFAALAALSPKSLPLRAALPIGANGADAGDDAFVLEGLLSPQECVAVIAQAEGFGFQDIGYSRETRITDRVPIMAGPLASVLLERARPFLKDVIIAESGEAPRGIRGVKAGRWTPVCLNSLFRVSRYQPGGHFQPHHDGGCDDEYGRCSLKTFNLYLNESFDGGATTFYREAQKHYTTPLSENLLHALRANAGSCLVFNHRICHGGDEVTSGVKYILRSEVMYEHVGP